MSVSRRQFIECGAAAGAVCLLSGSTALAAALEDGVVPQARPPARVMVDPVVDSRIVARARASFERHRSRLRYTDVVGIADFSKPSNLPRFYLLDTASGRVSSHLVSHGRGSDPAHSGWLQRFSNLHGSNASSDGGYLTGDFYYGRYGRSMRLSGLDPSNSNAEARAIVVHSAWYAEPNVAVEQGRLGRSEGCFAMSYRSLQEVLARLGPGRFLYADKV
ncbi:MAG: murein L,D-transpeptidase catalytic domain family protein [Pseudomonadota bacterium]|nr:murein L,D-transpeptidase catalytic domain family protein [Pseudomonadota bacterium]